MARFERSTLSVGPLSPFQRTCYRTTTGRAQRCAAYGRFSVDFLHSPALDCGKGDSNSWGHAAPAQRWIRRCESARGGGRMFWKWTPQRIRIVIYFVAAYAALC